MQSRDCSPNTWPSMKPNRDSMAMDSSTRGRLMAKIRSKNTQPELTVRRLLFSMGYRYRIHRKDIPGSPDIAFISRRRAIFVNGCFWHQHEGCRRASVPATNQGYWLLKLDRNRKRDARAIKDLKNLGWKSLTIWECQTVNRTNLIRRLQRFLGPSGRSSEIA